MTIGFDEAIRNQWLDNITAAVGSAGLLTIYDGSQPATGAGIGGSTLLVQFTLGSPFAAAASSGQISPTLPSTENAVATGDPTWYRVTDSSVGFVMDGAVGDDMIVSNPTFSSGDPIDITSWVINAPNG